jgi:hypothetical protein
MKWAMGLGMAVVLMVVGAWAAEKAAKSSQEVTVTGELSCAYCKLATGSVHKCSPECCAGCIKGGNSTLLQDGKNLYLLMSKEKEKNLMTPERIAWAGSSVKVKGIKVQSGGLQAIYVETMDKSM